MMNIVNGGCHALSSGLDVQEFMIMPVGRTKLQRVLKMVCRSIPCACSHILKGERTGNICW